MPGSKEGLNLVISDRPGLIGPAGSLDLSEKILMLRELSRSEAGPQVGSSERDKSLKARELAASFGNSAIDACSHR